MALVPLLVAAIAFGAVTVFASDEPELSGTTVQLPTSSWKPGQGGDDALIQGVLRMDDDYCVYLESGQDQVYAVWPAGWRATRDGELLTIYNGDLEVVARDGDAISTGGGFVPVATYEGEPCLPESGDVAAVQGDVTVTQ
ncbi:hypothetical protein [Nocardioides sp. SR21]|uniref:hypothetical protein n=1 Tax=Nocardioides sp. SR21 TaxID=2919501 RepID=UPI001FA9711A|nr:hypothetical protein [Nocardioides sp. SR21]